MPDSSPEQAPTRFVQELYDPRSDLARLASGLASARLHVENVARLQGLAARERPGDIVNDVWARVEMLGTRMDGPVDTESLAAPPPATSCTRPITS